MATILIHFVTRQAAGVRLEGRAAIAANDGVRAPQRRRLMVGLVLQKNTSSQIALRRSRRTMKNMACILVTIASPQRSRIVLLSRICLLE